MRTHPEQTKNEIFVGNVELPLRDELRALATARTGKQAYDITGKPLRFMAPLFIGHAEADAYDRIMMARFRANSRAA